MKIKLEIKRSVENIAIIESKAFVFEFEVFFVVSMVPIFYL